MAMYHWEADQEDFLVVVGEALLIVEGEERPIRQWDFVHCPPGTKHTILGAGDGLCVVVAVGAREHQDGPHWGAYTVDEVALRHEAGVAHETTVPDEAYAPVRARYGMRERPSTAQAGFPSRRACRPRFLSVVLRMRTYVRRGRRDDPPRRPRCVLRVGRAARRPPPARTSRHRRWWGRAGRELRGEGVRHPDRDGRPAGAPPLSACGRRAAADVGVLRGEQGRVRGVRGHDAARRGAFHRRSVPRRPRARATRRAANARSRRGFASESSTRWVFRSPWGSHARSSSRRSRAR